MLFFFMMIGVLVGFIVGVVVNFFVNDIVDFEKKVMIMMLIGFFGEFFMNMLKLLILFLIVVSLICVFVMLDFKVMGKIGSCMVLYYFFIIFLVVIFGIVFVVSIWLGELGNK